MRLNIACGQIPPRKSIAQNPAFLRQAPIMAPVLEILQYGKFWGPVNSDVVKDAIQQVFVDFCQGGTYANAAAAVNALETQLNRELRL
jgi:ABC-type glycerol-3-phosphate transport system substrate-binding protein